MLVIRFLRVGKKNQPAFKIVVVNKRRSSKSGRFVEEVGFYNPLTKEKVFKTERIKYWISVGAQPSPTVHNLLIKEKILEGKKKPKHKKPRKKEEKPAETKPVPEAKAEVKTEEKPVLEKKEEKVVREEKKEAVVKEEKKEKEESASTKAPADKEEKSVEKTETPKETKTPKEAKPEGK